MGGNTPISRKLPFSPEMPHWEESNFSGSFESAAAVHVWAALIIIGFRVLLRGSGILNLRWCGVALMEGGAADYLLVCISRSKTDTEGQGLSRGLFGNGSSICALRTWGAFLSTYVEPADTRGFISPLGVLRRVRAGVKWIPSIL